jgi:Domain of unknown function (DUF3644)
MAGEPMPRSAQKYVDQISASDADLENFLIEFPAVDARTGLHIIDDELLLKSREAMIFAVQAFNNPTAYFKAEMFIVASMVAWTYLIHAFFNRSQLDHIYRDKTTNDPILTPQGQPRYWDLTQCLKVAVCPLSPGEKRNLHYLLGLRHEIEHRSTRRVDHAVSAKLQACCLNFNAAIKRLFGERCGLDRDLSVALQFARVDAAQLETTSAFRKLPAAIAAFNASFDDGLSNDELNDPAYAYRVALVPITINNPRKADGAFEVIPRDSKEAEAMSLVLRDRERPKLRETDVLRKVSAAGFPKLTSHWHRKLVRELDARNPGKGFGVNVYGRWFWYEHWVDVVQDNCEAQGDRYR